MCLAHRRFFGNEPLELVQPPVAANCMLEGDNRTRICCRRCCRAQMNVIIEGVRIRTQLHEVFLLQLKLAARAVESPSMQRKKLFLASQVQAPIPLEASFRSKNLDNSAIVLGVFTGCRHGISYVVQQDDGVGFGIIIRKSLGGGLANPVWYVRTGQTWNAG